MPLGQRRNSQIEVEPIAADLERALDILGVAAAVGQQTQLAIGEALGVGDEFAYVLLFSHAHHRGEELDVGDSQLDQARQQLLFLLEGEAVLLGVK